MSSITQQKFYIQNIPLIFLLFLPFALISGPFLSDLFLVIVSIFFLFFSIKDKKFNYFNNFYFKIFSIFYLYILIRSIFSEDPLHSLESSLFYFRYGIFVLAVAYLLLCEKNFFNAFHFILYLSIFFVCIDAVFQFISGKNFFGFEKSDFQISGVFGEEQILGS
ncbi:O-antigen polymerase, partial [Pelagibacteraceae bacterium]|nr:O-antigen polymerase [Pelagibacteraceae bacterium]